MRLTSSTLRLASRVVAQRSLSAAAAVPAVSHRRVSSKRDLSNGLRVSPQPLFSLGSGIARFSTAYNTPEGTTLSRQGELLKYDVPELQSTFSKYLRSVEPFLTAEEMEETKKTVEEFLAPGGEGEKLQSVLKARVQEKENWLADWWQQFAYLGYRNSVVVNSSPGLLFPKQQFNSDEDQMDYAARIVSGFLDYKLMLDKQVVPVDLMGGEPLDMQQYYQLFGACRVPDKGCDRMEFHSNSNYIVVAHKDYFYKLPVYTSEGNPMPTKQIYASLLHIAEEAADSPKGDSGAGLLTSDQRDAWQDSYTMLKIDNDASLKTMEGALLLLALDPASEAAPDSPELDAGRAAAHAMHGSGLAHCSANRWFDKTIQIFVSRCGHSGLTYEHTTAEAVVLMNITNHVLHVANGGTKFLPDESCSGSVTTQPEQIVFKNLDRVKKKLETAKEHIDSAAADLEMLVLNFSRFGKGFIKRHGFSPDSFLQMALQLAFYRIHNTPGAHYESAGLRRFKHGRTDIIRSCSAESIVFAKAMTDASISSAAKHSAMTRALKSHSEYAKMTSKGEGIDRHLFGLMIAAGENMMPVPAVFNEPAYIRSTRHRLSTSQVSGSFPAVVLYGPLVADGYGVCYNNRENDITVSVSAAKSCAETTARAFTDAIDKSLAEMHDLIAEHKE